MSPPRRRALTLYFLRLEFQLDTLEEVLCKICYPFPYLCPYAAAVKPRMQTHECITNISLNGNPISVPIHGADVITRLKDGTG